MKCNSLTLRLAMLGCGALLAASAHANLVTNGDFEAASPFTGWTVTNAASGSDVSVQTNFPHAGSRYARFGATGATFDTISQNLATVAGATYSISYWLRADNTTGSGTNDEFQFNWDGGLLEQDLINQDNFAYTNFTSSLVASSALTTISFAARDVPGFYRLDDVSVEFLSGPVIDNGVPEPTSLALVGLAGALAYASRRRKSA